MPILKLAKALKEFAIDVFGEAKDEWVKNNDVCHRQERNETTTDFPTKVRTTRGDFEVFIEC